MPDRREEDLGTLAWPGFVDILSAVIIMFVFFVMILAIIMFVMTIDHKETLEARNQEELESSIQEIKKEIEQEMKNSVENNNNEPQTQHALEQRENALVADNQRLSNNVEQLEQEVSQLKADLAKALEQDVIVKSDEKTFIILFQKNEMSLTEDVQATLSEFIQNIPTDETQSIRIEIGDMKDPKTISFGREISLARSLNIRNVFLTENIDPAKISVTFSSPQLVEGSYDWAKITYE